jgi:hypothetical protein
VRSEKYCFDLDVKLPPLTKSSVMQERRSTLAMIVWRKRIAGSRLANVFNKETHGYFPELI